MRNDAAAVLADMHEAWAEYALPRELFRDDDYYVINGNHELLSHYGSKQREPVALPGQRVLRGMQAKQVTKPAIWQIPRVPAFLRGAV